MSDLIKRVLREPLLHFMLAGAGLFLLHGFLSGPGLPDEDEIIVNAGRVEHLSLVFLNTRQRPPTEQELAGLIDNYVMEEVLAREAIKMGLDRNDTIIRRRLKQKMDFLLDDFTDNQATEQDLQIYVEQNPEKFRTENRISFVQVYFRETGAAEIAALAVELEEDALDPYELGDSSLLPVEFDLVREGEISARFGDDFKVKLFSLPRQHWIGPVKSPFGMHLVRIGQVVDGEVPVLDAIRGAVQREWLNDRRKEARQLLFEQLKASYRITIETDGATAE